MKNTYKFLFVAFVSMALVSCDKNLLDVPNGNNPDFAKVYSDGADVENVASGLFNAVFHGEHSADGVEAMMATAADHATCSWGNFGMRDMSWEPRNNAWDNSPAYAYAIHTAYSYNQWYSAVGTASNVLKAIESGTQIGPNGSGNARVQAFAKFALGAAYGNLAMVFDRAHIVDDVLTVEPTLESTSSYQEVAAAAVGYLDEAAALANGSFTIPASWLGTETDMSSAAFKRIINTLAARILAYTPRNKAELAQVDWNKVRTYADNGITSDWEIVMDGTSRWYFEAGDYLTYPGWGRTDMYVVNMMEPSLPQHWEDNSSFPHPSEPTTVMDNRLTTDFEYLGSNDFQAARGFYHFTCYRFSRLDDVYVTLVGPKANIRAAENDMLRAEARAYSGDLAGAAAIINAGTRVTRGGLAPVASNLSDIIQAIHHERHVECYTTGMGLQFFEMRKLDLLQKGTPLHFPLPASILQNLGESMPFYTFGTVAKADGTNTSSGGWR